MKKPLRLSSGAPSDTRHEYVSPDFVVIEIKAESGFAATSQSTMDNLNVNDQQGNSGYWD